MLTQTFLPGVPQLDQVPGAFGTAGNVVAVKLRKPDLTRRFDKGLQDLVIGTSDALGIGISFEDMVFPSPEQKSVVLVIIHELSRIAH